MPGVNQENGFHTVPSAVYDGYASSDYGTSPADDRSRAASWMQQGHGQHDRDHQARNIRRSAPSNGLAGGDMTAHLLYETALLDSQSFAILDVAEVEELRKEQARISGRLEAANRKLTLERKVRDAASNLQRLHSMPQKSRPDTPQSPTSSRASGHGEQTRDRMAYHGNTQNGQGQADASSRDEFGIGVKKVDELHESIRALQEQYANIDRRLLSHTAAILAERAVHFSQQDDSPSHDFGRQLQIDHFADDFDSIRDILHGKKTEISETRRPEHDPVAIQQRLERLNERMRASIEEAMHARGRPYEANTTRSEESGGDTSTKLAARIEQLEHTFDLIDEEQVAATHDLQDTQNKIALHTRNVADYETTVGGLWEIIKAEDGKRSTTTESKSLKEDFSLAAFSSRVQNLFDRAQSAHDQHEILRRQVQQQRELNGKSDAEKDLQLTELQTKNDEMQRSRADLEQQLNLMVGKHAQLELEASHSRDEVGKVMTEFESLQKTVESRQKEYDAVVSQMQSRQQEHDTLTTQMQARQKQYDDMAAQLEKRQKDYEELASAPRVWQTEHDKLAAQLESLEKERDGMASQLQVHQTEQEEMARQLQSQRQERDELASRLHSHETERGEMTAQLQSMKKNAQAAESLESEIVRLTTELTMAKAELDGAYGTRAERKKEAEAAHGDRTKALEQELQEMTTEFQELTRESVEMEKEREQLEALIDSFRERCETLETELGDEKAKWIGFKSIDGSSSPVRESTSVSVMRQEFRKMMREARVEGLKALKAEQEERRRLESDLRRMRHGNASAYTKASTHSTHSTQSTPNGSAP